VLYVFCFCRLVQHADSMGGNESPINNNTGFNSLLAVSENLETTCSRCEAKSLLVFSLWLTVNERDIMESILW
jgi:hypothetical protein